ncbi:MAG: hypothetical protein BGP06_03595 [Rhizobiales bacterium 65-9]|nr:MAG: hypothetical protein BGP06_03595 [Rhizobiales bacterium 65-9]
MTHKPASAAGSSMPSADEMDALRRRAKALGLSLAEDDLLILAQGWSGLQPFLVRLRRGLEVGQRPPVSATSQ